MTEARPAMVQLSPEQRAEDPWLCHWSEFYFTGLLAHLYNSDTTTPVRPAMIKDGEPVPCLMIRKDIVSDVPFEGWASPRNVKLGKPSGLLLTGEQEDTIVIPIGDEFMTGRTFGPGLRRIDELAQATRDNEYIQALYGQIRKAKTTLGANTYEQLYQKLKQHFVKKMEAGV